MGKAGKTQEERENKVSKQDEREVIEKSGRGAGAGVSRRMRSKKLQEVEGEKSDRAAGAGAEDVKRWMRSMISGKSQEKKPAEGARRGARIRRSQEEDEESGARGVRRIQKPGGE